MEKDGDSEDDFLKESERLLPIANITRLMRKALPSNAKVGKDARECVQECVTEFISFITSEASDKCLQEKRKTINGDDLIWALNSLGFEKYIEPLRAYLHKYRESLQTMHPAAFRAAQQQAGYEASRFGGALPGLPQEIYAAQYANMTKEHMVAPHMHQMLYQQGGGADALIAADVMQGGSVQSAASSAAQYSQHTYSQGQDVVGGDRMQNRMRDPNNPGEWHS
eukprot:GHVL01044744.1.p2 GENE.GHVL01044744.1~~GHVL01044744.1.p2  ORF type:complete len:224 (+),score=43.90 GHVL01044744.1:99-770(+)